MTDLKWKILSSETIFESSSRGLRVQKRVYECEDGRRKTLELKDEGPFGHVFALTSDKKVILVRQFRPGPDKYYYESPAGKLDKGDDPREEVLRELREETGYTSDDVTLIQERFDMAYSTAKRYLYLAVNCVRTNEQELDEDEYIDSVYLATIEEVKEMIKNDEYMYPLLAYMAFEKIGQMAIK